MSEKTRHGNFFEDFRVGQKIAHATPRTLTEGDVALYTALTGSRFATSADTFAHSIGFPRAPIDDLLTFNMVYGRTVPDISLSAIANLGYAIGRFGHPVYPGDTLSADSTVIGLKENSDGKTGIVYVRSCGVNQRGQIALDYCSWFMVHKRDPASPPPETVVPELPTAVAAGDLRVPTGIRIEQYDTALSGSTDLWNDYEVGECIDHVDGMTIEESEHMMATRLYQNNARLHFNQQAATTGRFGRRLIYGGHILSLARSLSFNGLANAFSIAAINGGRHVAPAFASDTIYAWSEVLEQLIVPGRNDIGALRLRTVATRDQPCADFPYQAADGRYDPSVLLDFDYTVLIPRRE
ncbi:MAG TPA: MaoC family dehydratase [Accumulibacter sp.]|uniref:Bifunctional aldehyde dehydrogenase/enoyl-CoA hydratase n=1 Tax=Candidatus Accumulibacter cognatus TaxID=2954383 RepID=A0A080M4D0_9PROT|nr:MULTISPECIES: MaoC family dehydratase [Candidatus Accumulibacter]KFB76038.1 MAG: bifunctional aldehyde dehydrogenase/enoyl-CoA hydratase [Candidatus Accumulibacter cognatus]MBN8516835.1 MaoC family dehydratase [Accumulibacter sp.]MBO3710682.1 MaoC family dehydratase [Accumulibacter sp.]HMW54353.1 MaoC family dehydratase [Accumulibacter sp.]HNC19199.1 MaoC family dehydratase [Accumulibacter sp.]